MTPRDFDEEQSSQPERSPGVYTRAENLSPQDLDMLWSSNKIYQKEDRSPLFFFFAGFLVSAILTSAVFLILNSQPKVNTGEPEFVDKAIENPLNGSEELLEDTKSTAAKSPQTATPTKTASSVRFNSYVVKSGDTLGSIAQKAYGSSEPQYVEKIQRANNMATPDALQIDQKLVIPPAN